MRFLLLAACALFIVGAIAEARNTHTVWGQAFAFWMLLAFACVALEAALTNPKYKDRLGR